MDKGAGGSFLPWGRGLGTGGFLGERRREDGMEQAGCRPAGRSETRLSFRLAQHTASAAWAAGGRGGHCWGRDKCADSRCVDETLGTAAPPTATPPDIPQPPAGQRRRRPQHDAPCREPGARDASWRRLISGRRPQHASADRGCGSECQGWGRRTARAARGDRGPFGVLEWSS